ncbi:MAG: hypothetical protein PHS57_07085 [Alphaproteobacteria bacterium]|nr:hypothetical protein [Alphaproteobacteria bacterium]
MANKYVSLKRLSDEALDKRYKKACQAIDVSAIFILLLAAGFTFAFKEQNYAVFALSCLGVGLGASFLFASDHAAEKAHDEIKRRRPQQPRRVECCVDPC